MSDQNKDPVIGRLRLPDGSERPVYEDDDGRMYVKSDDGSITFGVWSPPAYQPLAADESSLPPWEQEGAVRRDCEPHRGRILLGIAVTGVVCSLLAVFLIVAMCMGASLQLLLLVALGTGYVIVSVTICAYAAVAAGADLKQMCEGRMDPAGWRWTEYARACGVAGACMCFVNLLLCALGWLMVNQ